MVYWTKYAPNATIERISYDWNGRTVLVNSSISSPNAIVVDGLNHKIYWGDDGTDKIERANLDGSNRELVIENVNVFGLSLLGKCLVNSHTCNHFGIHYKQKFMKISYSSCLHYQTPNFADNRHKRNLLTMIYKEG